MKRLGANGVSLSAMSVETFLQSPYSRFLALEITAGMSLLNETLAFKSSIPVISPVSERSTTTLRDFNALPVLPFTPKLYAEHILNRVVPKLATH